MSSPPRIWTAISCAYFTTSPLLKRYQLNAISRRRFVIALGASAVGGGIYAILIEPNRVIVTRHEIVGATSDPADPTVRVVQISDLHLQRLDDHARRIAETVNELRPDIIVFTGDMIDKRDRLAELRLFLNLLPKRPLKFATLGNWEHWGQIDLNGLRRLYDEAECRLLVNETAAVRYAGREALITGLDDSTGGRPDLLSSLRDVRPNKNHLLLAHSPAFRDVLTDLLSRRGNNTADLSQYRMSCMLSGHTHGGQVALLGWAPITPRGSGRYVAGWYNDGFPMMYVSRGLGTSVAPVRFGAPPEIAVFEWRLSAA